MKRPGEEREPEGGRSERRQQQFEQSRGLSAPEKLPLEEEAAEDSEDGPKSADDEPEGGAG